MRTKLFFCAMLAFAGATALGCASTDESRPHTVSYAGTAVKKAEIAPSVSHAMITKTPLDPHAMHGPISLTGETSYAQRFDSSGWSGTSTPPEGMGGGPLSTENAENPYDENATPSSPTQKPTPAMDSLQPSAPTNENKDLETNPYAE